MIRKCPNCKDSVSPVRILRPAFWKSERIRCRSCDKVISKYWEEMSFVLWIVLGVSMVLIVELVEGSFLESLKVFGLFYISSLVVIYFIVPLEIENDG